MQDFFRHLLPEFSALWVFSGEIKIIELVGALLWLVMMLIMVVSGWAIYRHRAQFKGRLNRIRSLIEGVDKNALADARVTTRDKALKDDPKDTGLLWQEFDESLVYSSDKTKLSNTLEAEHFFNSHTLAPGLTSSRLLAAAPSFLTALGLLGTFVGLMFGLKGLKFAEGNTEALKVGIEVMISGASAAFMTSVWGVLLSLVLNFIEKIVERGVLKKIRKLQHDIDTLYPRLPAEQSLVQIAAATDESKFALQELHERIGDRLQETINGVSESMQEAFTRAIETVMEPAIQALVSNTSQQSTQALEGLVTQFMEGLKGAGAEQGQLMERAAGEVQQAVSGMSTQMGNLFSQLEEQAADEKQRHQQLEDSFSHLITKFGETSEGQIQAVVEASNQQQNQLNHTFTTALEGLQNLMGSHASEASAREQQAEGRFNGQLERLAAEQQQLLSAVSEGVQKTQQQMLELGGQHQHLMGEMKEITQAVQSSSQNMSSAASQLGVLSGNLRTATDVLDKRMEAVSHALQGASEQNEHLAKQVGQQAETIQQLQAELLKTTEYFGKAAQSAEQGFEELEREQQKFLQGISSEFRQLGEMLTEQVQSIEKQASEWLRSYSSEVRTQVGDRMEQWNANTLQFADEMRRTVNVISSLVDDLEQKA